MGKLSDKMELFCQEYIIDFNATQAAIRAKYKEDNAYAIGAENLRKPQIKKRISELINDFLGTEKDTLRMKVIQELAIIAFSDVTQDINVVSETVIRDDKEYEIQRVEIQDTKNSNQSAAIAGIKKTDKGIEVKYHDKTKALELLGKFGALWTEKIEHSGSISINFDTQDSDL